MNQSQLQQNQRKKMTSNDAYLGNPNLKKTNTAIEFTEEQIKEFQKSQRQKTLQQKEISLTKKQKKDCIQQGVGKLKKQKLQI